MFTGNFRAVFSKTPKFDIERMRILSKYIAYAKNDSNVYKFASKLDMNMMSAKTKVISNNKRPREVLEVVCFISCRKRRTGTIV